jgi:hypothetical protein
MVTQTDEFKQGPTSYLAQSSDNLVARTEAT